MKSYFYFLSAGISDPRAQRAVGRRGGFKGAFPPARPALVQQQHTESRHYYPTSFVFPHHFSPPLLHITHYITHKVNKFGYNFTVEIADRFEIFGFLSRDRYVTSTTHNPHSSALPIAHLSYFVKKTLFQTPAIFEIKKKPNEFFDNLAPNPFKISWRTQLADG